MAHERSLMSGVVRQIEQEHRKAEYPELNSDRQTPADLLALLVLSARESLVTTNFAGCLASLNVALDVIAQLQDAEYGA